MNTNGCGRLDEVIAELALGLLGGAERAAALAHIELCPACQAEAAALTAAGEQLLLLAPEVPPPAGFESRVLARIEPAPEGLSPLGPSGASRSRWRPHRPNRPHWPPRRVLVPAVAAAVALLVGMAALVTSWVVSDEQDNVEVATTAMLNPRGDVVATATLRHSAPPVMEVDFGGWLDVIVERGARLDDRWWLSVEATNGATEMYAVSLTPPTKVTLQAHSDPGDIAAVALVDDDGQTWCSGRFRT